MSTPSETHEPITYAVDYSDTGLYFPELRFWVHDDVDGPKNDHTLQGLIIDELKTYVESNLPIPVANFNGNGLRYVLLPETSNYIRKYNEQFNKKEPVDQALIDAMKGESS